MHFIRPLTVAAVFTSLLLLTVVVMLFALSTGSSDISWSELFKVLLGSAGDRDTLSASTAIIVDIRLPRVLTAFNVGALLALAGCLMQVLLRNPLAEPYVLGLSGGASVAVLLATLLGASFLPVSLLAFVGAFGAMWLVFFVSHSHSEWDTTRLLLTGVLLATGFAAFIAFILSVAPAQQLPGMLFWLMGDLSYASLSTGPWLVLILALGLAWIYAPALNLLQCSDMRAASLGVNVKQLRYLLFFLSSLLTAFAVMQAGSIGFVGLIVPHLSRLLVGNHHRLLLPVSLFIGGNLLILADTMARTLLAPQQLPVGIFMALLGVPFFLLMLWRQGRGRY